MFGKYKLVMAAGMPSLWDDHHHHKYTRAQHVWKIQTGRPVTGSRPTGGSERWFSFKAFFV